MPFQKNTTSTEHSFDVLITGAGIAGCCAAIFLRKAGYKVCLLQKEQKLPFKVGESLPPVANKLLQQLGVWESFSAQAHLPCYGNKSAWGSELPAVHDFMRSPYGHGWHIDRLAFEELLLQEACRLGAVLITSTNAAQVLHHESFWKLQSDTHFIEASFLFDAGGRNSAIAKQLGFTRSTQDKQVALCGFFENVHISQQFSFIEAVEQGWWYTAPLPNGFAVSSLFTIPGCLQQKETAEKMLVAALEKNPALHSMLRNGQAVYSLICNAGSSKLDSLFTDHYVAIGDAALTFDPISSHGLVTAMTTARDASAAYDALRKGETGTFAAYSKTLQDMYDNYEAGKTSIYASEQRWPQSLYWKQKHGVA